MRKHVTFLAVGALLALILAACSGYTTSATSVTSTSATLNYFGGCGGGNTNSGGTPCQWFVEYDTMSGTSLSGSSPATGSDVQTTAVRGPVNANTNGDVALNDNVTGLSPGTQYQYKACGKGDGTASYICLGYGNGSSQYGTATPSTFTTTSASNVSYHVSSSGSDSNPGTQSAPLKTLGAASALTLHPGDSVLLKRGDSFTGGLTISQSGSSDNRINVGAYGTGALPTITGGLSGDCVKVSASFVTVDGVETDRCGYAGIEVDGSDTTVKNSAATGNSVGVYVAGSNANVLVTGNTLNANNILNVNNPSSSSGAFGVLLNGPAVVSNNTISNDYAPSQAYQYDGSGVELYNASNAWVHNNILVNNDNGVEMGGTGTGNTVEYNKIIGNLGSADPQTNGIVVPGSPTSTFISHNSIDELGTTSQGIVCYSSCAASDTITSNAVNATTKALSVDRPPSTVTGNVFNGQVQGMTLDASNSTAAIKWTSPPNDLTELATSPTIDHATITNFSTDLAGNAVPDASGTPSDSGAYEFSGG